MAGKHDGRPFAQGFVPRYGCGTYVLVWLYAAAANLALVLLDQWPNWSAGFAATAAGACFGCATLATVNSYDRRDWDRKHPQQPDDPKSYSCDGCAGEGRCDGSCHLR